VSSQNLHDDSFLLEALKKGNEDAFELLFKKYSGRLYYVAFKYLNDREETLEIVQEVFYKVWLNHQNIRPELPFIPYLSRIAKNLIINQSKRKLIENAFLLQLENNNNDGTGQTENQVIFSEISSLVEKFVNEFPEKRKEIFILSRKKGLTNKEIAVRLNISESTVENHINSALKYLRTQLKTFGYLGGVIFLAPIFY
jgi:RNA polymerase sigma-70 factor (ECF subfamily)